VLASELIGLVGQQLKPRVARTTDVCPAAGLHFPPVASLTPRLRWEGFPRELDRERLDPAQVVAIGKVTYDVRIWEVEDCERGRRVYERTGLARPEHPLEQSLRPGTRYYWAVRARFTYEGRPMVTRWSSFNPLNCHSNDVADWQYHRFVTPATD
jgi:hypothetical protein